MKLGSEKEFWSVLMTIREKNIGLRLAECTDWTDKYLLFKYADFNEIYTTDDKDYFNGHEYPELTYVEFMRLYGGKDGN